MRRPKVVVAALLLALASCASVSAERRLQIACSSYADTLHALAVQNGLGLLSDAQEARVDKAVAVISPVCREPSSADPVVVIATIEAALITMIETRNGQ